MLEKVVVPIQRAWRAYRASQELPNKCKALLEGKKENWKQSATLPVTPPPPTSFLVALRTLMRCTDPPLEMAGRHIPPVFFRVGRKLPLPHYADQQSCTHSDDS